MAVAVLITGGNRGDVAQNMGKARELIEGCVGRVVAESSVRESQAWGEVEVESDKERVFLNQVLVVETTLKPMELLKSIQSIEKRLGRVRTGGADNGGQGMNDGKQGGESGGLKQESGCGQEMDDGQQRRECGGRIYQSRTMDIDILLYEDLVIEENGLEIPHPMMHKRAFVLEPLSEVMPQYKHPRLGMTVEQMLKKLGEIEHIR